MKAELGYQTFGEEGMPVIVFIHGGGVSGWMWEPVVRLLQNRFYCILPDLPEFGRSREIAPLTIPGAAGMIAELIYKKVTGGKACVVGLSEGAQITVQMLADHPEVVEGAVISSALVREGRYAHWITPGLVRWSYRISVPPFRNVDWWIRLNMKYSAGVPEQFFSQFKAEFQALSEDGFVHVMMENQKFRMPAGLEASKIPVLVVVGSKEYTEMKKSAQDLLKVLPNGRGVQVDLGKNASLAMEHNWVLNVPDLAARTITAFMQDDALPQELKELESLI